MDCSIYEWIISYCYVEVLKVSGLKEFVPGAMPWNTILFLYPPISLFPCDQDDEDVENTLLFPNI